MRPRIEVEFCLTGHDLPPAAITEILDLAPTKTWLEGDPVQGTALRYKHNGWCLSLGSKKQTIHLEDSIRDLLQLLLTRVDRICQVSADHNLHGELSCVVYMRDEAPSICLSPETISALARLGAGIDIDIILAA